MVQIILGKIKEKIPKDFFQVFVFDLISKMFTVSIAIILIRVMTPTEYSYIVKFQTLSGFIYGVFGTGIALSFIRYSTEQLSRGFRNTVGLHAVCSVLIIVLSFIAFLITPLLCNIYNTNIIVVTYACYYGFISSLINMNQAYFQSRELYVKSGITNNLKNIFIFVI